MSIGARSSDPTSCVGDSPVRTSVWPESGPASTATARGSGENSPELFARFDRLTSSWRTSQACLLEGWEEFSATWPSSGTMRNGKCFPPPTSAPRICGAVSGLWPTPTRDGAIGGNVTEEGAARFHRKGRSGSFVEAVAGRLWPTPDASATERINQSWSPGAAKRPTLALAAKLWPTPTVDDAHNVTRASGEYNSLTRQVSLFPTPRVEDAQRDSANNGGPSQQDRNTVPLNAVIGGALNPRWVEWLMGYPLGWTALADSEMPSSRIARFKSSK